MTGNAPPCNGTAVRTRASVKPHRGFRFLLLTRLITLPRNRNSRIQCWSSTRRFSSWHTNRALLDGTYTPLKLNESDQNVFSYLRSYKGEVVLVALNMSASPQKVDFELSKNGFSSANSLLATPKSAAQGDILRLEPYGVFIGQLSH